MSKFPTITLIVFSLFWILYTTYTKAVGRAFATSEAAQMENRLLNWADKNVLEEDLEEIRNDYGELKLGDKSDERSFRETVQDISTSAAVPIWPGLIGLVIGVFGAIRSNPEPKSTKDRQEKHSMDTSKS